MAHAHQASPPRQSPQAAPWQPAANQDPAPPPRPLPTYRACSVETRSSLDVRQRLTSSVAPTDSSTPTGIAGIPSIHVGIHLQGFVSSLYSWVNVHVFIENLNFQGFVSS